MSTVIVKNISAETSEHEIKEFFSFCGKISDIQMTDEGTTKSASVTFERETAMATALLLNNTQMGKTQLSVASASGTAPDDSGMKGNAERDSDEITQEEKPRSRILAEYLAHGYVVGDAALKRAIDLDHKHGVSTRFLSTLQNLDKKYSASEKAKATDASYGITQKAGNWLSGIGSYFEKAGNTPTGQRIVKFYEEGSRQVQDIHAEARRLAELKKDAYGGSAYKAAGLEKVFGKEKDGSEVPPVTGETTGTTSATPAATTEGIPASTGPAEEKKS